MKFLLFLLFFVVFLSSLNFTYSYNANAISPKFPLQTFQDKNEDVNFYSRNDSYLDKSTENQIINLLDIETGAISSNGTHLEIKVFFQDSLNNLIDVLTSKNILLPKEYFMDILIDSDADEDTGFLGYDYRYEIKNNGSVLQQGITDNNNTTITNPETNLTESLQDSGLLTSNELNTVITDTSKSEYLLSQLKWIISGYEIVNYQYILQFFHDNAYPKYLKLIPKGFKITLDLGQFRLSRALRIINKCWYKVRFISIK